MTELPRLSRELVSTLAFGGRSGIEVPPPATLGLPEKIVQFGTGAFLRGFIEAFVDGANRRGELNGSIVAVASTESRRDTVLNEQDGLYTLVVQGREGSSTRQRSRIVSSLSRAISARMARAPCADTTLWSADLAALDGFADLVGEHLVRIVRRGVRTALDTHLTEAIALT